MRQQRGTKRSLIAFLVVMLWAAFALPALAHSGEESYVYLDIYDSEIEGRVEFPVSDLNDILGTDIPQEEPGALQAIEASLGMLQDYAAEHLTLGQEGRAWQLEFSGYDVIPAEPGTYAVLPFTVVEDFTEPPRTFEASYRGIIEAKPEKSALLIIGTDFGSGTFNNEADHLLVFTPGDTDQTVDLGERSWWAGLMAVVGLGVEHIQIGSDHILFILALVLPAVLIFREPHGWLPAPSFGSSLWRVVKIATSFTVAHTITLTLGGLGVIELSPRLVEPVIAVSIALAALHNLRPVFQNKEWLIAFGFGLFHGFGFAGLLADLGLTRTNRVVSLLGFNLGIEIGQVVIILLVFPALFLLRRTRAYNWLMSLGSLALAVIAVGWFVDRVFEIDSGVDRIVEPVMAWPRPLYVVALFTAVSAAYWWYERSRGELLPLEPEPEGARLAKSPIEA